MCGDEEEDPWFLCLVEIWLPAWQMVEFGFVVFFGQRLAT